jgi:hypothetical protein
MAIVSGIIFYIVLGDSEGFSSSNILEHPLADHSLINSINNTCALVGAFN